MRTVFRVLAIAVVCLFFNTATVSAQDYGSAIGLRLGYPVSLSYKTFISDKAAVEAFVNFRSANNVFANYGWTRIGLGAGYQVHNPINGLDGLYWYYGGGASVYFWSYDDGYFENEANLSFGIQGYLGLDYKFAGAPINISLDWVPTFFLNGYGSGFGADNGALAVRYTLN